jgi:hypothetical protein
MEQMLTIARAHASHPRSSSTRSLWIGILNHLFSGRRYIASAPSLSSTAESSQSCGSVGVLDGRVGGGAERRWARGWRSRRSVELRASHAVGLRWQAVFGCQTLWSKSTRAIKARSKSKARKPLIFSASMVRFSRRYDFRNTPRSTFGLMGGVAAAVKSPFPFSTGRKSARSALILTVELVKHISRLLQSVQSARIIAQKFLFDGGR